MHLDRKRLYFIRFLFAVVLTGALAPSAFSQKATVTVSLNEAFFDALLESVFQNFSPPEFPLAEQRTSISNAPTSANAFAPSSPNTCPQTVKLLREMAGTKTAVRFRDGKVYVPLAFSGTYSPPFIGCVEFAGWAETNIDLEFDPGAQRLVGRARVFNVNLNGTGGIGGPFIARLIQSSLDKKLNPIEILTLDRLSFAVPVQRSESLRMRAVGVRPAMGNGVLNLQIDYVFQKG